MFGEIQYSNGGDLHLGDFFFTFLKYLRQFPYPKRMRVKVKGHKVKGVGEKVRK